jgi:hypothetical protein
VVGANVLQTLVGVRDCAFYRRVVMSCSMIVLFWSSWVESCNQSRGREKACTDGEGLDPGRFTHDLNVVVADTSIAGW